MDAIESVELLKSTSCRCGRDKQSRMAFCRDCFYRLPPAIRKALYNRVGFGFEQSYDLALRTLEEMEAKL